MKNDDQDCFGMPDSAFSAAHKAHGNAPTVRCGMYVPTRAEVASMAIADLRPILIDWLHESPSELIPSIEQVSLVKTILEARPDAAEVVGLIEECRQYIEG
jgi:hypothetical protein